MTEYESQVGRMTHERPQATEIRADERDLRVGLAELAGLMPGSGEIRDVLVQIAAFAAPAIPGADGAGVTLLREFAGRRQIHTWGASSDVIFEIERLQYEVLDEGPCITCMQTRRPVVVGSLGDDRRWSRFGGQSARLGVHSALALPLLVADDVVGALNAYARRRDAFDDHAVRFGAQFAGPAAVAARNAQLLLAARTKADQLQAALNTRAVIDQAIGIVRSRSGGSSDDAFAVLRRISQSENTKLSVVAQRLVDDAVRRAHSRHRGG